eukprot:Seg15424.1 transcript_id=Seg15424.1/GoldUCD/mRNA.D3Y31 product="hypothetical protein" protein_id=Seg15424.1/GoldUCD/D3Y31
MVYALINMSCQSIAGCVKSGNQRKVQLNMMSGNCSTSVRKIIQSLLEQWKVLEQLPCLHPLFRSTS